MSTPPPNPGPAPALGVLGAKRAVRDRLQTSLDSYYNWLRAQWGLPPTSLIPVTTFLDHEIQALTNELPPCIAVTSAQPSKSVPLDYDEAGANPVFRTTYPMRVFFWTKVVEFDEIIYERDRTGTAIRNCLIDLPSLGAGDAYGIDLGRGVVVDASEVKKVNADRYVAGGSVSFDLDVDEAISLNRGGIGVLADVELDIVYPLAPKPTNEAQPPRIEPRRFTVTET